MLLLADECIDKRIVDYLRGKGYDVIYVAELAPSIPDNEVLDIANEKSAILLTNDKDFGELVFRQRKLNQGIVLIRLSGFSHVKQAINRYSEELPEAFTVISPNSIRIRKRI